MDTKISIDKITILGDTSDKFETIINNNQYGFIEGSGLAKHPYDRNFYMADGSLLQYAKTSGMKALRYEFNPNKINDDKEKIHSRSVAECIATMKYPKLSRVDIAIDLFDVNIADYEIHHDSVKTNEWRDRSRRLETLYVGAPNSDMRFRIYNKAKEQQMDDGRIWWRIEAQLRDEFATLLLIGFNPFEKLSISQSQLKQIDDIRVRSMLYYLEQFPEEWSNINRTSKERYKKILNTLTSKEEIKLAAMYQHEQQRISYELSEWLKIAERNNVI